MRRRFGGSNSVVLVIAQSTLDSERYRLRHFLRILTNKRLREISNADLDLYASKRLEEGVGAWSINKELLCGALC